MPCTHWPLRCGLVTRAPGSRPAGFACPSSFFRRHCRHRTSYRHRSGTEKSRASWAPGGRRRRHLLHEFEPDATGGVDEGDAPRPEGALDHLGSPDHLVALQLGVEIVGEQGRVEEALGREVHLVLVDGLGEQRDHHRSEEDVGPLTVAPLHAVPHLGPGRLVVPAGAVEVRHLHGQIGQSGHRHIVSLLVLADRTESNDGGSSAAGTGRGGEPAGQPAKENRNSWVA